MKPLWTPSPERAARTALARFMKLVGQSSYAELHRWSVAHSAEFWNAVWDFCGVRGEKGGEVVVDPTRMPGAKWFPHARLNYAENLLRNRSSSDAIATASGMAAVWLSLLGNVEAGHRIVIFVES